MSEPTKKAADVSRSAFDPSTERLALMLGGGGARGAYQAGVLRGLASLFPELRFPIMTGISAGAVNTIHLASHEGTLGEAATDLARLWMKLSPERVYDVRSVSLARNVLRWGGRLLSGGIAPGTEPMRGMVDTDPLRQFLRENVVQSADGSIPGIARNIARGSLHAVALSATSYTTAKSTTWVEGRDVQLWHRPQRRSESARLTVEHVMASSALPLLFPAVRVGDEWYGDGGIRLTAPLSPALHLGATRILTISTRPRSAEPPDPQPHPARYPAPAQVLGVLYNSIFLDLIDEDILRLGKVNRLLEGVAEDKRDGMRIVDILVIRPSQDLRGVMREVEPRLPTALRHLTRGLGTRQAANPDFLSLILFQSDYIERLLKDF